MKLAAVLILAIVPFIDASSSYSAKQERAAIPLAVSTEQRTVLETRALCVQGGDVPVMRIWFRKAIPVQSPLPDEKREPTYRDIAEGTFAGVLEFPKVFTDYRRQKLPAGVYTLRYAIQPDTGDHTDTSPHREFFLLTAPADDRGTEPLDPKQLIALSRKVNEGTHPAVLLLWPVAESDPDTAILDEGMGVLAASVSRAGIVSGRKTKLRFAITVSGTRKL
jgi:hypothetical protein